MFHESFKSFRVFTAGDGLYFHRHLMSILLHPAQCFTGLKSFKSSLISKIHRKSKHTLYPFIWQVICLKSPQVKDWPSILCVYSRWSVMWPILVLNKGLSRCYWQPIFLLILSTYSSYSRAKTKYLNVKNLPTTTASGSVCLKSVFMGFRGNITGTGLW